MNLRITLQIANWVNTSRMEGRPTVLAHLWNFDPLYDNGLPVFPTPFSPVVNARKFSACCGHRGDLEGEADRSGEGGRGARSQDLVREVVEGDSGAHSLRNNVFGTIKSAPSSP